MDDKNKNIVINAPNKLHNLRIYKKKQINEIFKPLIHLRNGEDT